MFEEISIFRNSSHLEWRAELPEAILVSDWSISKNLLL
jgi:hypothetical protein